MDDRIQKLVEPNASTNLERFDALKKFKELGCQVGVMAMPLLPGIGDTTENIEKITSKCAEIGVDYIIYAGLTLKPGNKAIFYKFIQQEFPRLEGLYHSLYDSASKYGSAVEIENYKSTDLMTKTHEISKKYGIPDRMPRYIPEGANKTNLRVSEVLQNMIFHEQWIKGTSWFKLKHYYATAHSLETFPIDIKNYSLDQIQQELGLSRKMSEIIHEIISTGTTESYQ
jgi:DNA repair photolyase